MIITYYSYKGGAGRTQLLANLAAYFCHHLGKKILLIDWDLEAPGLHFFFEKKELRQQGLIEFMNDYKHLVKSTDLTEKKLLEETLPDTFNNYIANLREDGKGIIDLMPAGKYDDDFSSKVSAFDWREYYENFDGVNHIEIWKKFLKGQKYDFVFVDSRTGIHDYAGICNIQMADANLIVVTPTEQGFSGSKKVVNAIANSKYVQSKRRKPIVIPILSRIDPNSNELKGLWIEKFKQHFREIIHEWFDFRFEQQLNNVSSIINKGVIEKETEEYIDSTFLEYKTDISFGEKILFSKNKEPILANTYQKKIENIAELILYIDPDYSNNNSKKHSYIAAVLRENNKLLNSLVRVNSLLLKDTTNNRLLEDKKRIENELSIRPLENIKDGKNLIKSDDIFLSNAIEYALQRNFKEAESYFRKSLQAKEYAENTFEYAYYLLNNRDYLKALPWFEKSLSHYKELAQKEYLQFQYRLACCYNNLANINKNINQINKAKYNYETALEMFLKLEEIDIQYKPYYAIVQLNYADLLRLLNEFSSIDNLYSNALSIFSNLADKNPFLYFPYFAKALASQGGGYKTQLKFIEAEKSFLEALSIYRTFNDQNSKIYLPHLATTLNDLANLHLAKNEFEEALSKYEEALQIRRALAEENPRTYLPDVAMTLNNLANLHSAKNEFGEALAKYEEALQIRRALAEENPRTYLPYVATTLNNLANLQKAKNEFGEALAKYEEALQMYRALAEENPRTYLPDVAMTLNNLAVLQKDKNEFGEALAKYEEALQIYRALAEENPRMYLPDVAMTLNNLAILQKDKKEFGEALAKYEEALQIYRALAEENPRTYLPYMATTLNNLAVLQKDKNEFGEALAKYEEALQIRRVLAEENPRTYLPDVAVTLNNLAVLQQAKNEFEEALSKYEEALQIRRTLAEEHPQTYLPDVAMTAMNMAIFYLQSVPDREKSLAYCTEALGAGLPFAEYLPSVQHYLQVASKVIAAWGEDPEAFLQNTRTQMNEQPSP